MRSSFHVLALACVSAVLGGCTGNSSTPTPPAPEFRFVKPSGGFYSLYTGPQRPALNAIAADGSFNTSTQTISLVARMAGPVFDGAPNFYVFGFDRGGAAAGTAPFAGEPNVKFNAVALVTANANGTFTGVINLLNGAPAQPIPFVVAIAPDTIQVQFPAAMLPSTGVAPALYTWNLWPRSAVGGSAAAQIASFIPENAMASLTTF
jgi:hypothetical protein